MRGAAAAAMAGLLAAACSVIGVRDTPEPPHVVIDRPSDEIEVRRYAPRAAAEATLPEADSGRAFRLLFDYISGENAGGAKIAMTAPVTVDRGETIAMTAPVAETREGGRYAMRFFLPADMSVETAPRPTDPRIAIVSLPETTVAVRRFSGLGFESSVRRESAELLESLEGSAWRPVGEVQAWFYDPPWTLPPFRRNEVAAPVEPRR